MAWILSTLWSELRSTLRFAARSWPSRFPVDGAVTQAPGMQVAGACTAPANEPAKRFYSLMIEVRPDKAKAETLQLFSDAGSARLAAILNLPAGCSLRRCMEMSSEMAEVLIRM